MPRRQGLNCTLSYTDNKKVQHAYRIRAGNLSKGIQMVSAQSSARTKRAYYPHRTALQQFSVQALLKDWDERRDLVNWLATYCGYALDPDTVQEYFPWMRVEVPARQFLQFGVPLRGYEWGAHTGMMMFTPELVFEAAKSPGQTHLPVVSSVINKWTAFTSDRAIEYFYPFGIQLSGNQQGNYSTIQYPGDPTQFNGSGSGQPPPGVGGM